MSAHAITDARIAALTHPITDLDDRPMLSADDLKAYFDANPNQLCTAHNQLVDALTAPEAASEIGFTRTAGLSADTLQDALNSMHTQLQNTALGSVPDGSVSVDKLSEDVQQQLTDAKQTAQDVTELQTRLHPSGTQFPLMVLALADGFPTTLCDEVATAALGMHYGSGVSQLGEQLTWLCRWKRDTQLPSDAFRAKNNLDEIFTDPVTLQEIETLTTVRSLISLSAEASHSYRIMLDNVEE